MMLLVIRLLEMIKVILPAFQSNFKVLAAFTKITIDRFSRTIVAPVSPK